MLKFYSLYCKLSFFLFSVILLTPSTAIAQQITVLNPALVYNDCLDKASSSGIPTDSCLTDLPHEATYADCSALASQATSPAEVLESCKTAYVNSVASDHLNNCLATYPSQTTACQNSYAPNSGFASCINTYKNPSQCENIFGFKPNNSIRDLTITFRDGLGISPNRSIGDVVSNAIQIVFIAAGITVLIYLIIGAFRWITSGGDKEAIGKARGTIVNALIGLAILALAFFITVLFGQILNINILNFGELPSLNDTPKVFTNTP